MFDPQPHLVGELIELRPLRAEDFEELRAAAADPRIWEQHPADRHDPDVFRAFFDEQLASGGGMIVLDRRTGEVIGTSRYHDYDAEGSTVEIGWTFLVRRHWGGTNREVKRLMLDHAFRSFDRVFFHAHPDNLRSQRAIEKLGAIRIDDRPDGEGLPSYAYELARPEDH